jgi:hypothetical protein
MEKKMEFKLDDKTNYIYIFFVFSAKDCAPNRDGGTGEIRQDSQGRVFTTQECFNQNVKNGVFYGKHSGLINTSGTELLGCKNEAFGPRTLKGAQKELLASIGKELDKDIKALKSEDVFNFCFDIPLFGMVNSNGWDHSAVNYSLPGSAGLIFLPTTFTQVAIDNRGISNSFSQPQSGEDDAPKGMPGSHYTDFLTEGVFGVLGIFNVRQLKFIAKNKFKIADGDKVRKRIEELYHLYIHGIWEGFKLLGYASTMRRGQQPISLYSLQCEQLCENYITAPADLLRDESEQLRIHETIEGTLKLLESCLPAWFKNFESEKSKWSKLKGRELCFNS